MNLDVVVRQIYEGMLRGSEERADAQQADQALDGGAIEIVREIVRLDQAAPDPFFRAALVRCVLRIFRSAKLPPDLLQMGPRWARACVAVGSYGDAIELTDILLIQGESGGIEHRIGVSLLLSKAKAQRNLGDYDRAVVTYRGAMKTALAGGLDVEVAVSFLLLGKLHGNYRGQRSLFLSFVQEALGRLESMPQDAGCDKRRVMKSMAICHDALGQAYRASDQALARRHFEVALRLHEGIDNRNGICRSRCHLHFFDFFHSQDGVVRSKHLEHFQDAITMLKKDDGEERGLAIRWVQYAQMLHAMNRKAEALECVAEGRAIAQRHSDFRTLARANVIEAELCGETDVALAVEVLERGREVAEKHGLLLEESTINLALARLASTASLSFDCYSLFVRNREILLELIRQAKLGLTLLNAHTSDCIEFEHVSAGTRQSFRENLLVDFEEAVLRFNENIAELTTALRSAERRRHDLVALAVVNSVATVLLHELKTTLPAGVEPLQLIPPVLERHGGSLLELIEPTVSESTWRGDLIRISTDLKDFASRIRAVDSELLGLKSLLSRGLKKKQVIDEWVSVSRACDQALTELALRTSITSFFPPDYRCDVRVLLSTELMVSVIQNLFHNALDASSAEADKPSIYVRLIVRPPATSTGSAASLTVLNAYRDAEMAAAAAAAIDTALQNGESTKSDGNGLGLAVAQCVLTDLVGAEINSFCQDAKAGIEVLFKPASTRCEISQKGGESEA